MRASRFPGRTFQLRHWLGGAGLLQVIIVACVLFGVMRAAALLSHDPLLAYANSYDEVRYTACFDLYPDRPREIPPTENSPWAPFSRYVFIPGGAGEPMCYWSSELLPQAIVVAGWEVAEALGGSAEHSVRALGMLKFALLLGLNLAFTVAWWRRRRPVCALANAALLPLLFADPANTLYANTFYAEWTALTSLYASLALILVIPRRRGGRRACALPCWSRLRRPRARHQQGAASASATGRGDDGPADRLVARASVALAGAGRHAWRRPGTGDPGRTAWPRDANHRQHENCQRRRRGADGSAAGVCRSGANCCKTRARSEVPRLDRSARLGVAELRCRSGLSGRGAFQRQARNCWCCCCPS